MADKTLKSVQDFVRPDIAAMKPYTPVVPMEVLSEELGRPVEEIIKLNANENLFGPSPKALEALANLKDDIPIYPDPEARRLRAKLAALMGVGAENIFVGFGADEIIDLIMRLFFDRGEKLIDCPPTFSMYAFDAALVGAEVIRVPRLADYSLDIPAIRAAVEEHRPKAIFLTTPNNPDGGVLTDSELNQILNLPVMVIVDQAYAEFSAPLEETFATARRVASVDNLAVIRTFSKWAGLAGLRVGYGVFPRWMMQHLWKMKQPYNLNVAADAAARASLDDIDWLKTNLDVIRSERERMYSALDEFTFMYPYPSKANFILCQVTRIEATDLKQRLSDAGILIRYYKKPGLEDHIRISIGTPMHNDALLNVLKQIEESL